MCSKLILFHRLSFHGFPLHGLPLWLTSFRVGGFPKGFSRSAGSQWLSLGCPLWLLPSPLSLIGVQQSPVEVLRRVQIDGHEVHEDVAEVVKR